MEYVIAQDKKGTGISVVSADTEKGALTEYHKMTKKDGIILRNPIYGKQDIINDLKYSFVSYAKEVNANRAFPYLNGLKPIHQHIITAMWANKRFSDRPFTKSAKVEGEIMAYSPHAGAYSSFVRMAQPFIYHIPLIEGHGSFGSVTGGPKAGASRYTECRLSKYAEDVYLYNTKLLDMGLNYLEEDQEPKIETWTCLLPQLFIMNTEGMGYTASNQWTSGNLKEFRELVKTYLKTGKVNYHNIYPDFPTGGVITNKSEMESLYKTGKGNIVLRGNATVVGDTIKITSLPYQVYPEDFMESLKKFTDSSAHTIKDVANRSGMSGMLIEIECERGTADYMLAVLYKKTNLQITISDEHKAVVDGKPQLITLEDYVKYFIDSNIQLVVKEANYNLDSINARLEIVNGLLSALDIIDEIIKVIKHCKSKQDAKDAIMKHWKFTENQAQVIVAMPLGNLANLEQVKLQDEKKQLDKDKAENEKRLKDKKEQQKYFYDRFSKLVDKYGWDRKTEVIDATDIEIKVEKPKSLAVRAKKEFMIVLANNYLKKIPLNKYHKTGEDEKSVKVTVGDKIALVTNTGMMYKVSISAIKPCLSTALGTPVTDLIDSEDTILSIFGAVTLPYIAFVTSMGYAKMTKTETSLGSHKKSGLVICKLKDDTDRIIAIKLLKKGEKIQVITNKRTYEFEPKLCSRSASCIKAVKLKKEESIAEVHSI